MHHAVNLGDHLHIGVFDAVVHRFDEVTRARGAHIVGTRLALILGGNGVQDGGHAVPIAALAATHDSGAVTRALFTTRHTNAQKARPRDSRSSRAARGVMEQRIARVDDQIIAAQQWRQVGNHIVNGLTRGHHQDNRARWFDRGDQILQALGRRDHLGQRACFGLEAMGHSGGAVPNGNRKALFRDIERQHRSHSA